MIQPDYPSALGLLSHLNADELKEMLNDDAKFDDTVLKDVKQPTTKGQRAQHTGRITTLDCNAYTLSQKKASILVTRRVNQALREVLENSMGSRTPRPQSLDSKRLKYVTSAEVKDWETEKEMIIASNRSLAEYNLGKEPELEQLKSEVQRKSELGEQLCTRIQELLGDYKTKSAGISPDTTHALLETSAAEAEEQSEQIAQDFTSGTIGVEKFLEDFESIRKKMHLRKFKAEKMTELFRSGNQSYGNGMTQPYLPYPSYGNPQVPSVPYPVNINMPMPNMYGNHF